MSMRNPLNDRYTSDNVSMGKTRKSAAAAKPKSKAGASVKEEEDNSKKRLSHSEKRELAEEAFKNLGPRAREKFLEQEYVKWNNWRRRMIMLAFASLFIAMIYYYVGIDRNIPTAIFLWALPFVFVCIGIWINFRKQRPLGYLLGMQFGRKANKERILSSKERQANIAAAMKESEERARARVEEKQAKVNARESRRLRARAAEAAAAEKKKS